MNWFPLTFRFEPGSARALSLPRVSKKDRPAGGIVLSEFAGYADKSAWSLPSGRVLASFVAVARSAAVCQSPPMNPFRRFLDRFRKPVGFSPGVHVPADPAEHAIDFSRRWADKLDRYVAERMEELGISPERIGSSDHRHGIAWCAFNPYEDSGGGVSTGGRINVDSGVFNLERRILRAMEKGWKGR
jgi:hypothetical protein